MGAESRVAVDREGKHPIVEVPICKNKEKQQFKKTTNTEVPQTKKNNQQRKTTNIEKEQKKRKKSELGGQAARGGLPAWGDGRSMAISNPGDDEGGRCSRIDCKIG